MSDKELLKMQTDKEKNDKKSQTYYCEVLNQKFSNYATFEARITSKKYQKALETFKSKSKNLTEKPEEKEEEMTEKVLEDGAADGFKKKRAPVATTLDSASICLFTNCMYDTFEDNLFNMRKRFGFFILDENCCVNKEGLIKYLAKQIQNEHRCIYCHQHFKTADSTQKHIVSKQHALMNSDYFTPYEKFFDFREENRLAAKRLQEKYKHVGSGNHQTYMIKNKPEAKEGDPAVSEDNEDDWADDNSQENESKIGVT